MVREGSTPSAPIAEVRSENRLGLFAYLSALGGISITALTLATSANSKPLQVDPNDSPGVERSGELKLGMTTGEVVWGTKDQTRKAMSQLLGSVVHIEIPIDVTRPDGLMMHDDHLCDVYSFAGQRGKEVIATVQGYNSAHQTGEVARGPYLQNYTQTITHIMQELYGPDGCAPNLNKLEFDYYNEPNPKDSSSVDKNGNNTAKDVDVPQSPFFRGTPEEYLDGLQATYTSAKSEAQAISRATGKEKQVIIDAGAFAPSKDPFKYFKRLGNVMTKRGIKVFPADRIDWHAYPVPASASPIKYFPRLYYNLIDQARRYLNYDGDFIFGESGSDSETLEELSIKSGKPITGEQAERIQGEDNKQFLRIVYCFMPKVKTVMTFGLTDEANAFHTGLLRPNGQPKLSWEPTNEAFDEVSREEVDCGKVLASAR